MTIRGGATLHHPVSGVRVSIRCAPPQGCPVSASQVVSLYWLPPTPSPGGQIGSLIPSTTTVTASKRLRRSRRLVGGEVVIVEGRQSILIRQPDEVNDARMRFRRRRDRPDLGVLEHTFGVVEPAVDDDEDDDGGNGDGAEPADHPVNQHPHARAVAVDVRGVLIQAGPDVRVLPVR